MTANQAVPLPLNEVQLMLLRLFSRPMDEQDMESIRAMLMEHYETLLQKEIDRVIKEKGIGRVDFERVLNSQQRTK